MRAVVWRAGVRGALSAPTLRFGGFQGAPGSRVSGPDPYLRCEEERLLRLLRGLFSGFLRRRLLGCLLRAAFRGTLRHLRSPPVEGFL
jgi:hypothetical protein